MELRVFRVHKAWELKASKVHKVLKVHKVIVAPRVVMEVSVLNVSAISLTLPQLLLIQVQGICV